MSDDPFVTGGNGLVGEFDPFLAGDELFDANPIELNEPFNPLEPDLFDFLQPIEETTNGSPVNERPPSGSSLGGTSSSGMSSDGTTSGVDDLNVLPPAIPVAPLYESVPHESHGHSTLPATSNPVGMIRIVNLVKTAALPKPTDVRIRYVDTSVAPPPGRPSNRSKVEPSPRTEVTTDPGNCSTRIHSLLFGDNSKKSVCIPKQLSIEEMLTHLASAIPQKGHLLITDEERKCYESEGLPMPSRLPLTAAQQQQLRYVRRKIKNKLAAHISRQRKRQYVDQLETQLGSIEEENVSLKERVKWLEERNTQLTSVLHMMQQRLSNLENKALSEADNESLKTASNSSNQSPATKRRRLSVGRTDTQLHSNTVLTVVVLCFALVAGCWHPFGIGCTHSSHYPSAVDSNQNTQSSNENGWVEDAVVHGAHPKGSPEAQWTFSAQSTDGLVEKSNNGASNNPEASVAAIKSRALLQVSLPAEPSAVFDESIINSTVEMDDSVATKNDSAWNVVSI